MVHRRWRWRRESTQSFGRPKWRARRLSSSGWVTERNERARCLRTRTMHARGRMCRHAREGIGPIWTACSCDRVTASALPSTLERCRCMTTVDADPRAQTWPEVDAFQDLLATLARGLDVREFFQRL